MMVVVQLLWLSGRALAVQARGVLGSTPGDCQPFHFPLFLRDSAVPSISQHCSISYSLAPGTRLH